MVDFQDFDMFKANTTFHIMHTNSSDGKKTYLRTHGSFYGMIMSLLCVTILLGYLYVAFNECYNGEHDILSA